MVTEATRPSTIRPYGPPSNVITTLHRLRSRNLPERIDAEYLRDAGIPEGTISRTLFAIRFLRLVNDAGIPTDALRSIHTSTEEEYHAILSQLIREAYSEVFAVVDPAEDPPERILNVFRRYTPASQRERMVTFFLGMCREAGIPALEVPRKGAITAPRREAPRGPASRAATRKLAAPLAKRPRTSPSASEMAPALEGLIRNLPELGRPFSAESRRKWLNAAEAILALLYPEQGEAAADLPDEKPTQ